MFIEIKNYIYETYVPLNWNGIILDRYLISNYGRIFDRENNCYVGYSIDKDGYYMASITVFGVGYKKIRVHRFELLSFDYNDNFMNLQVNHKDGNKQNLFIGNLEWVTPLRNTRHGWETGLNHNIGINNGNGKYDEQTIRNICELIDQGKTNPEIMNIMGIKDKKDRMRMSATLAGIRRGKTHIYISKDFSFMSGSVNKSYSEFTIHLLCQFLSDGNTYSYKDIMGLMHIPNEDRKLFKIFINDVIRKRTGKVITDEYYSSLSKPIIRENDELASCTFNDYRKL